MDLTKMEIHTMHISDLDEIKENLSENFNNFWNYKIFKDELANNNSKYIVAKTLDNIIVGFAGIKIIFDEVELMNIVTKKNSRNLGIASFMLEALIDLCNNMHIKKINLEVNSLNTIAINLYKKYNFNVVGLRKKYYDNTYDAILMSLAL